MPCFLSCFIIKVLVVKATWPLIRDWYIDMAEFVCIERKSSRTYMIQQGTRQRGVLSPWLFLVFFDDLIEDLQSLHAGVSLHIVYLGSPMFADDLTMLSRTKSGLDINCYKLRGNIVKNGNLHLKLYF